MYTMPTEQHCTLTTLLICVTLGVIELVSAEHIVTFLPQGRVRLGLHQVTQLTAIFTTNTSISKSILSFNCSSGNEDVATAYAVENKTFEILQSNNNYTFQCKIYAVKLGKTNVTATTFFTDNSDSLDNAPYVESSTGLIETVVVQPNSVWNTVVQFGMLAALALNSVAFGLKIDWHEVKEFLKRPCGILIAVGCQYVLLPVLAFLVGLILDLETHIRVALLAISCVPGGLPSNAITLALNGDINLSIVLTAIGNLGAFVMTPLWMYTLGQKMLSETFPGLVIRIPWLYFCLFIAILTVPTIVGVAIGVRHPKIAPKLAMAMRLIGVSGGLVLVGLMLWVYEWAFDYFTSWKIVVAGILTPYIAIALSFALSMLALRSLKYAITIMIETGVQNISFSFFLIGTSLPQPEASLATSIPAIIVLTTYVPFLLISLGRVILEAVRMRRGKEEDKSISSLAYVSSTKFNGSEPSVIVINNGFSEANVDSHANEKMSKI